MKKEPLNKEGIYKAIGNLALKLLKDRSLYSRADIAFELKNNGIESDSALIEDLLYGACESLKDSKIRDAIKKVFYNNSLTRPLVEDDSVKSHIRNDNFEKAISLLNNKELEVNKMLCDFADELNVIVGKAQNYIRKKDILSTISGAALIKEVKAEAEHLFKVYEQIVVDYNEAKQSIVELVEDYCLIRTEIVKKYRVSVTQLTDIFGPNVKAIEPSVFDYDSIEWIETDSMLKNMQLEFDNLMNSCSEIINVINDSFLDGLSKTCRSIGKGGNNKFALAMAGLEVIRSWTESSIQATKLSQGLEKMNQKMEYDVSNIKGDMFRLQLIDKAINEVHIPAADTFRKNFDVVFSGEVEKLLNVFYQHDDLQELKRKKDELLNDYHKLEIEIEDHKVEVKRYSDNIQSNEQQLKDYRPLYLEAQKHKPKKPFFLFNILSLGSLKKTYNRDVAEWYQNYNPVIEAFCEFQEDIRIDKEELKEHSASIKRKEPLIKSVSKNIEKQSQLIYNHIQTDSGIQEELSKFLVPIVNLLRTARKIAEFKIADEHLIAIKIEKITESVLPVEVENRITDFVGTLRKEAIEEESNSSFAEELGFVVLDKDTENLTTLNNSETGITMIENQEMQKKVIQIVNNSFDIIEETARLKKLQLEGTYARNEYENQLSKLRNEFKAKISEVDDKAVSLRTIIKTINTEQGDLQSKALMELIDESDDFWITEKEIIGFLKEGKTITI